MNNDKVVNILEVIGAAGLVTYVVWCFVDYMKARKAIKKIQRQKDVDLEAIMEASRVMSAKLEDRDYVVSHSLDEILDDFNVEVEFQRIAKNF